MYELPISVQINGESFKIRDKGDFRMVLHLFELLNAQDLSEKERIIAALVVFYEDFKDVDTVFTFKYIEDAIKEMFNFINGGQTEPAKRSNINLIDWEQDSMLITSAVNNVAGKEIRSEEYLHWWTFLSYYMAIGECPLSQIVSIRSKIAHGKKLEKYEKEFKNENPQYFNIDMRGTEQKEAETYIRTIWNGGDT